MSPLQILMRYMDDLEGQVQKKADSKSGNVAHSCINHILNQ